MPNPKRTGIGLLISRCMVVAIVLLPSGALEADQGAQLADRPATNSKPSQALPTERLETVVERSAAEKQRLRQYTVDCTIIGKPQPPSITIKAPTMTVQDGVRKSIADTARRSVAIGRKSDGPITPLTQTFVEGSAVEAMVLGNGNDTAVVDITVEFSGTPADAAKKRPGQWTSQKYRVVECVPLGKTVSASFKDLDLEIVVRSVPTEPSPIRVPSTTNERQGSAASKE